MAKTIKIRKGNEVIIPNCRVADDFLSRFKGLMGQTSVPADGALFFPRCNSIHTFFMRMPIDVVFVDRNGMVQEVVASLAPWRMLIPRRHVKHTLELGAGQAKRLGIERGVRLICEGVFG